MPDLGQKLGLNVCFLKAVYMNMKALHTSLLNTASLPQPSQWFCVQLIRFGQPYATVSVFTTAIHPAVVPQTVLTRV